MMCPPERQINNHMLPVSASDQYESLLEMAEESEAAKSTCHSLKIHIIIQSTRVCRLTLMFCHIYLQIQGCNIPVNIQIILYIGIGNTYLLT